MDVAGKVFVVTGGGNGIGREVTLELLRRGGTVAAVDLRKESLDETADLAGDGAARLSLHALDITDRAAVELLPAAVLDAHGQVDGLLNIAGIIQPFVTIDALATDTVERVMNVNFWGTFAMTKAFLPLLLARPAASLVNVSSMGALVPVPGQGAYGASKAAVKLLTECLYAETQGTNVAVSVVFPGAIGTNITGNSGVTIAAAAAQEGAKAHKVTQPAEAGRQIVEAVATGEFRVLIGGDVRVLDRVARLSPKRAILLVANQMKDLLSQMTAK